MRAWADLCSRPCFIYFLLVLREHDEDDLGGEEGEGENLRKIARIAAKQPGVAINQEK